MRKDSVKKVLDRIDNTKSDLIKFLSDSIKFKSINPEMMYSKYRCADTI